MQIGGIDTEKKVLIVAEIGNNHEGKFDLAKELVRQAAEAGANAVKFQTFKTEHFVSPTEKDRFNRLKSFQLSYSQFEELSKIAGDLGLLFLSTPLDLESARFLNSLVPAFKIGSGESDFYPLLEVIAQTKKPIILSCGLAEIERIAFAKAYITKIWRETDCTQSLALLHCISAYPTPPAAVNLRAIRYLQQVFGCTVGYSDHTLGIDTCLAAVAIGATIIEKHFTLDKNYSSFRDHQLSADPTDLKLLVEKIRILSAILGECNKTAQSVELDNLTPMRRSIAAKNDLFAGSTLSWDNLIWLRPGTGLPPGQEHLILGKVLRKNLKAGDFLTPDLFE